MRDTIQHRLYLLRVWLIKKLPRDVFTYENTIMKISCGIHPDAATNVSIQGYVMRIACAQCPNVCGTVEVLPPLQVTGQNMLMVEAVEVVN